MKLIFIRIILTVVSVLCFHSSSAHVPLGMLDEEDEEYSLFNFNDQEVTTLIMEGKIENFIMIHDDMSSVLNRDFDADGLIESIYISNCEEAYDSIYGDIFKLEITCIKSDIDGINVSEEKFNIPVLPYYIVDDHSVRIGMINRETKIMVQISAHDFNKDGINEIIIGVQPEDSNNLNGIILKLNGYVADSSNVKGLSGYFKQTGQFCMLCSANIIDDMIVCNCERYGEYPGRYIYKDDKLYKLVDY